MKLLLDQNLSYKLTKQLSGIFETVRHVKEVGLYEAADVEIWTFAKTNQFTILTRDSDFNDIGLLKGFPPKIIWLRIGNLTTTQTAWLLNQASTIMQMFSEDNTKGILELFPSLGSD